MTHCLFDHGAVGVTARMEIKFRHPVSVDRPVHIRARLVRSSPPTHQLWAEISQDKQVKATAVGLFVDCPELLDPENEECLDLPHK
jgi:acyl-CoA thioesterase FadM